MINENLPTEDSNNCNESEYPCGQHLETLRLACHPECRYAMENLLEDLECRSNTICYLKSTVFIFGLVIVCLSAGLFYCFFNT